MYVAIYVFLRLTGQVQIVDHAEVFQTRQQCEFATMEAVATLREALVPERVKGVEVRCVRLDQR